VDPHEPEPGSRVLRMTAAVAIALLLAVASAMPAVAADLPAYRVERILSGYDQPLFVTSDGSPLRLFVVEQTGRIRVATRATEASPWQRSGVFLDLRSRITGSFIGRGLLGLAFHPAYATNGLFYVFYTRKHNLPDKNGDIVIAEFRRSTDLRADPASRRVVRVIPHPTEYHFGGWMGFGPDGYLYVSTGDAAKVALRLSQDLRSLLGKLLRLDPTDPPGRARHSIPGDNPYVGRPGYDLIWASGLRNPWRASFDRATGDL